MARRIVACELKGKFVNRSRLGPLRLCSDWLSEYYKRTKSLSSCWALSNGFGQETKVDLKASSVRCGGVMSNNFSISGGVTVTAISFDL